MSSNAAKVVVIGLDCAEPSLVFDRYAHKLPNLTRLKEQGVWGKPRSCDPPPGHADRSPIRECHAQRP